MLKKYKKLILFILIICTISKTSLQVEAAAPGSISTETATPIKVGAPDTKIIVTATDDNTTNNELRYAINTKQDAAFTKNSVFDVKKGDSYIVYVKDQAGNITSKKITVAESGTVTSSPDETSETDPSVSGTNINITPFDDLDIIKDTPAGTTAGTTAQASSGNTNVSNANSSGLTKVVTGDGTVIDTTGVKKEEGKEFYTIQTKDEHIFFLVIDHDLSQDNVYFLDTVTENDLLSLSGSGEKASKKDTNSAATVTAEDEAKFLEGESQTQPIEEQQAEGKTSSPAQTTSSGNIGIILIVSVIGGGVYYYFKIYKSKKRFTEEDDTDLEDFEAVDDDDEVEFKKVTAESTSESNIPTIPELEEDDVEGEEELPDPSSVLAGEEDEFDDEDM